MLPYSHRQDDHFQFYDPAFSLWPKYAPIQVDSGSIDEVNLQLVHKQGCLLSFFSILLKVPLFGFYC